MQTLRNKVEEIENITAPKAHQFKDRNLAWENKTATDKPLDLCHLQDVLSEVVLVLENTKDYPSMHVIFSAHVDVKTDEWNLEEHRIVDCFTAVAYNSGGYEPKTGIFTASCNGIYKCRVSVSTSTGQHIQLGLFKTDSQKYHEKNRYQRGLSGFSRRGRGHDVRTHVLNAVFDKGFIYRENDDILVATSLDQVEISNRTSRILCYVQLNRGDTLYVKSLTNCQNLRLHSYSQFTCSLLTQDLSN
ncbi:uncharacterized protein LOC106080063 [Biomphalaria glabrata]|uniref:Uncharacterized protein LOC106080063 n=1 Tax=Biomphalaria glabrata TaxID=6526 RepID=A0A9W2ZMJ6_BIOGL|nr:uncharacterized protein LOC106080063 [Biomphalaria glabrata]